jgi:hypothetical protein
VDQAEIFAATIFCDQGDAGALVLDENDPTAVAFLGGETRRARLRPRDASRT